MKMLLKFYLLFLLISSIFGNDGDEMFAEDLPILKDCDTVPDAFVLNSNDEVNEEILITQWYKWNIKIYDNATTYLDDDRISDINDLINGYFFNAKLIEKHLRNDFTPRQIEMSHEIFEIVRGFKKHFHHTAASQQYVPAGNGSNGEYPVQIQFPTNTKVCASFCGQEADVCMELTKIGSI